MRKNLSLRQRGIRSLLWVGMAVWVFSGCAGLPENEGTALAPEPPTIEAIKVNPSPEGTEVEIVSSGSAPYAAFELQDPARVVLDIRGVMGSGLARQTGVNDGNVTEISFEQGKAQTMTSRMVIGLARPVDYGIQESENSIRVTLTPVPGAATSDSGPPSAQEAEGPEYQAHDPRIFFRSKPSGLNEIVGLDFTMLDRGKSRFMITTEKKAKYDLDRKGPQRLVLQISDATIPTELLREIDAVYFHGAVDRIKPAFSAADKRVTIELSLREMVPFHLQQSDTEISIDFERSMIAPPAKKIVPLRLAQAQAAAEPGKPGATPVVAEPAAPDKPLEIPGLGREKYTGAPMTMDFVNADVTNILRLIGEVSNLNIVWGPEVGGNVSMRLKNVPWDQALDLILANNDLAKRRVGNVIWVTTKSKMSAVEAEERKKEEDFERRRKEQVEREKALREDEPVETRYITVNFKDVENIRQIIDDTVKSDKGKTTVDAQTKTIIMTDTVSKIKEAEALAKRLDRATPQVMIEARIVEARTTFSRSLGIQWDAEAQNRNSENVSWSGTPAWAPTNVETDYPPGGNLYNPTFTTNVPTGWGSVLGLAITKLSSFGLTGSFIDAKIALSEAEGETKVLSSPKIMTRDTQTATIQQGTKIVIPSGTDANGNKTYEQVDASLKLEVTPTITPNDMVIMDVQVSDDSPDYANARGENIPINTKNAHTFMMVKSGDTIVIGGIYKEDTSKNTEGIPWISRIPLLGWLFKAEYRSSSRTELLIFLTPTLLPSV